MISCELVKGRDDDIIEYLARPEIKTSAAIREGLRMLARREDAILEELREIKQLLISGEAVIKPSAGEKYNDPFLDSSL